MFPAQAGWLRSALAGIRDMERRWREANAPGLRAAARRRARLAGAGGPQTRRDGTTLGLLAALGGTFDLDVVASDPASGAERTLDTLSWRQLASLAPLERVGELPQSPAVAAGLERGGAVAWGAGDRAEHHLLLLHALAALDPAARFFDDAGAPAPAAPPGPAPAAFAFPDLAPAEGAAGDSTFVALRRSSVARARAVRRDAGNAKLAAGRGKLAALLAFRAAAPAPAPSPSSAAAPSPSPSPAAGLGEAPVPPLDWWDEPPLY